MAFTQVAASLYVLASAGNPQLLPAYTQDCSHFAQVTHSLVHRNDVSTHPAGLAGSKPGDVPVEEKGALVNAMREAADDLRAFCAERDVDLDALRRLAGFELVAAGKQTVEMLMADDDEKVAFVARAALVDPSTRRSCRIGGPMSSAASGRCRSSSPTHSPRTRSGPTSPAS